jgi:hypothetical protein
MAAWTPDELSRIGDSEELRVSSLRPDGSLRPYVRIWTVRVGDELYVRSAYGPDNGWYVRAKRSGAGRIRAGGLERDVNFVDAAGEHAAELDAAYRAKYHRHSPRSVSTVVGEEVAALTLRLVPRDDGS